MSWYFHLFTIVTICRVFKNMAKSTIQYCKTPTVGVLQYCTVDFAILLKTWEIVTVIMKKKCQLKRSLYFFHFLKLSIQARQKVRFLETVPSNISVFFYFHLLQVWQNRPNIIRYFGNTTPKHVDNDSELSYPCQNTCANWRDSDDYTCWSYKWWFPKTSGWYFMIVKESITRFSNTGPIHPRQMWSKILALRYVLSESEWGFIHKFQSIGEEDNSTRFSLVFVLLNFYTNTHDI